MNDDAPTPAMIIDGTPWWYWVYSYEHDGKQWSFSICATSSDDADARLRKIALARLDGQQCGRSLPLASPTVGAWMMTARAKLRRLFKIFNQQP